MKNLLSLLLVPVCALTAPAEQVVPDTQAQAAAVQSSLPEGEMRLRNGIVILGALCQSMAKVQDNATAEAAAIQIMRLRDELQQWVRSFNNLPPLTELEAQAYQDRYLPTIRKINRLLETQAERIAAAEYYGSKNLAAALVHMAQVGH